MRGLCVLAFLVSGCATHRVAPSQPVFPVRHTEIFSSWFEWQRTPWYRPKDLSTTGPVYVVLGDGNRACVVTPDIWVRVLSGVLYSCPTGWREARHRVVAGATAQQ